MLKSLGAVLVRSKKHLVFKTPENKTIVMSSSPSTQNAVKAQMSDVRKLMPSKIESVGAAPAEKRYKPGRQGEAEWKPFGGQAGLGMADQLRGLGVAESALRRQVRDLEWDKQQLVDWVDRLRIEAEKNRIRTAALRGRAEYYSKLVRVEICGCWVCRIRRWWRNG